MSETKQMPLRKSSVVSQQHGCCIKGQACHTSGVSDSPDTHKTTLIQTMNCLCKLTATSYTIYIMNINSYNLLKQQKVSTNRASN
jgi:hypothetical protein